MINDKVVSSTKKEWLCSTLFINFYKILSQYLIKDLLQFVEVLFFGIFIIKTCVVLV